jgi:hypothetical protein
VSLPSIPHLHLPFSNCFQGDGGKLSTTCTLYEKTAMSSAAQLAAANTEPKSEMAVGEVRTEFFNGTSEAPHMSDDPDGPLVPGQVHTELVTAGACTYKVTLAVTIEPKITGCSNGKGELYSTFALTPTISGTCSQRIQYSKAKEVTIAQNTYSKSVAKVAFSIDLYSGIMGSVAVTFSGWAKAKTSGKGSAGLNSPTVAHSVTATTYLWASASASVEGVAAPLGIDVARMGISAVGSAYSWLTIGTSGSSKGAKMSASVKVFASTSSISLSLPTFSICSATADLGYSLGIASFGTEHTVVGPYNYGAAKEMLLLDGAQPAQPEEEGLDIQMIQIEHGKNFDVQMIHDEAFAKASAAGAAAMLAE